MSPRADGRLSRADESNVVLDAHDQVNVFLMAGLLGVGGFVSAVDAIDLDRLRATLLRRLTDPEFPDLVCDGRIARPIHAGTSGSSIRWQARRGWNGSAGGS